MRFLGLKHPATQRLLAATALFLLMPCMGLIALLVRLETRRPIFRSAQRFHAADQPVVVTFFQTRALNGRLGAFGGWLNKTGLYQLPMLIDVAAGRLSFFDPMPRCWDSVSRARSWVHELQPGQRHLARGKKDRYRSAA